MRNFDPLAEFYFQQWREIGWDYTRFASETCNHAHYTCPWCKASDRDRLYAMYLRERLKNVRPDFRFVDFAPSDPLSRWIKRKFQIQYRTADLCMEGVDDRVDLTEMSIYPTGSVDAFICSHMLEHIREDRKALAELFRILKPGGWGIIMVPIFVEQPSIFEDPEKATTEADRWRHFGQGDHIRMYNKQGFIDRVSEAGFRLNSFTTASSFLAEFAKCGISPESVLYVGEKARAQSNH